MKSPLVKIAVLCYNHASYIEQCLTSVLKQKTNFQFEIHVVDDASSDGSADVIMRIGKEYPEIAHYTIHQKNKGVTEVAKLFAGMATSKYACIIDADDYWTYPAKLQTQIDFLEDNPEYMGCFHDAEIKTTVPDNDLSTSFRSQNVFKTYSQFNRYQPDIYPHELIRRLIIPTASLVFRVKPMENIFNSLSDYLSLAWVVQLELIKNSKFRYFNECWSVYRDHPEGFSKKHELLRFKKQHVAVLENLCTDAYYKNFKADIYESIATEYKNMLWSVESKDEDSIKKYISWFKHYSRLALKYRVKEFKKLSGE